MISHTPGPWAIEPIFGDSDLSIILDYPMPAAGNPVMIGFACDADEHGICPTTQKEAIANARLIAAAPELLAAIEAALRIESLWCPNGEVSPEHDEEVATLWRMRQMFTEAIAKAKGVES